MNLRDLISSVSSGLQKGKDVITNFVTDLPANSSYLQAKVAEKIAPKWQVPTYQQNQQYFNSPVGQFENKNGNLLDSLSSGPTKSMSAQMNQYPVVQQTPENKSLETQKQQILNSDVFRPAMSRYLSTVPVNYEPSMKGGGMTELGIKQIYNNDISNDNTWETSNGPMQPLIHIGDTDKTSTVIPSQNSNLSPVMAHELIHASPRNMNLKDSFINFYNNVNAESNPVLWKAGMTYLMNGQAPPNPEELYATLAQNLGESVLNIPEIANYYRNVYNKNSMIPGNKNNPNNYSIGTLISK